MEKAATSVLSNHLNSFCTHLFEAAATYAASRFHYEITIEHVLIKLLEAHGGDGEQIWRYFKVDQSLLRQITLQAIARLRVGNQSKPSFSPYLTDWFNQAWEINTQFYHEPAIRTAILIDALVELAQSLPFLQNNEALATISLEKLRRNYQDITRHSIESKTTAAKMNGHSHYEETKTTQRDNANDLSQATFDLCAKVRNDPPNPVVARHNELHQLINILSRQNQHHPLLIGESGAGKTSVIYGLAMRICAGDVPDQFKNIKLIQLDKPFLQANSNYLDQLKNIINQIKIHNQPAIFVIEDIHLLFDIDGVNKRQLLNLLATEMCHPHIQFIITTTQAYYYQLFATHTELVKLMQLISIEQPDTDAAIMMLNTQREALQKKYHILITDEAIANAVSLSQQYINKGSLPEKAISVLDAAAALAHNSQVASPLAIEALKGHIACLEQRLENIYAELRNGITGRERILGAIQTELDEKNTEVNVIQQQWQREKEIVDLIHHNRKQLQEMIASRSEAEMLELKVATLLAQEELAELQGDNPIVHIEVNKNTIAEVIAENAGIPKLIMQQILQNNHMHLAQRMAQSVIAQNDALNYLVNHFAIKRSPLMRKSGTLGAYLLAGPQGVGKTMTTSVLSQQLFGSDKFIKTINCKLYQQAGEVASFVNQLLKLREMREYGIIVCEEIDKAHPAVIQVLATLFQHGTVDDTRGEKINFNQIVFLLTMTMPRDDTPKMSATLSYGASAHLTQETVSARNHVSYYSDKCDEQLSDYPEICSKMMYQLAQSFDPSFLANITVIAYRTLDRSALTKILSVKIQNLIKDLLEQQQIQFRCSAATINYLTEQCAKYNAGAWYINKVIDEKLLPVIYRQLSQHTDDNTAPKILTANVDELGNIQVEWADSQNNYNQQSEPQWHRTPIYAENSFMNTDAFELGYD